MKASLNIGDEVAVLYRRIVILGRVRDFIRDVRPKIEGDRTLAVINAGDRFIRIGMFTEVDGQPVGLLGVHAFVDRVTGEVFKAASLLAPAAGARYDLGTDEGMAEIVAAFDQEGTYLYNIKRRKPKI